MPSLIKEKRLEYCAGIFSLLYIVKSLRRKNVESISFEESVEYLEALLKPGEKKICKLGEIIFCKEGLTVGKTTFPRSQTWKVVSVIDMDNGDYQIAPYSFPNAKNYKIIKNINDFTSFYYETQSLPVLQFRQKYENLLIILVIYLCFLNCLQIVIDIDIKFMSLFKNDGKFMTLLLSAIRHTKHLFDNLDISSTSATPPPSDFWYTLFGKAAVEIPGSGLKGIIAEVHKIILEKVFSTETNVFDGLFNQRFAREFSNKVTSTMVMFAQSKIQNYSKEEDYYTRVVNEEEENPKKLTTFFKKMDSSKIPSLPLKLVFNYKSGGGGKQIGGGSSKPIDLFQLTCNLFDIQPDAMLTIIKKNFNKSMSKFDFTDSSLKLDTQKLTGLSLEEKKTLEPTLFTRLRRRIGFVANGGSKRKYTKKMYKGGLWPLAAVVAAKLGTIAYVAAGTMLPAGVVATGGGVSTIGGIGVIQVMVVGGSSVVAAPILLTAGGILALGGSAYYYLSGGNSSPVLNTEGQEEINEEINKNLESLRQANVLTQEEIDRIKYELENTTPMEQYGPNLAMTQAERAAAAEKVAARQNFAKFVKRAEANPTSHVPHWSELGKTPAELAARQNFDQALIRAQNQANNPVSNNPQWGPELAMNNIPQEYSELGPQANAGNSNALITIGLIGFLVAALGAGIYYATTKQSNRRSQVIKDDVNARAAAAATVERDVSAEIMRYARNQQRGRNKTQLGVLNDVQEIDVREQGKEKVLLKPERVLLSNSPRIGGSKRRTRKNRRYK